MNLEKLFNLPERELSFQADFLVNNDNSEDVFEIKYNNLLTIYSIPYYNYFLKHLTKINPSEEVCLLRLVMKLKNF